MTASGGTAPVTVVVSMRAKPGCADSVQEEITAQLRKIRSEEEACITIAGNRHEEDRDRFLIYEVWRSRAEFDAFYEGRESMKLYLQRMRELVAEGGPSFWEGVA